MATVLITGGTGFIGRALTAALAGRGYSVIVLSRNRRPKPLSSAEPEYAGWDIDKGLIDQNAFSGADHIIHLAGAGIAEKRWTQKRKQEIRDSRIKSSALLVDCLKRIPNKVKTVVCSSAIGWYGPDEKRGDNRKFEENDPPANDFLGQTCKLWEESIEPIKESGIRLVKLRTGIVLGPGGGALSEFVKPLRFGIAAILGNGRQMVSWIHMDDLINIFIRALENEAMQGTYNAVAPGPVSNKILMLQLARSRRKFFIPLHIPSFLLKLRLGEMSVEVLKSATVSAKKILAAGYVFAFPEIDQVFSVSRKS